MEKLATNVPFVVVAIFQFPSSKGGLTGEVAPGSFHVKSSDIFKICNPWS